MNDIRKAFAAFWGSFLDRGGFPPANALIPAWQTGYVPRANADTFPRITYDIARPDFADFTILSASIWDRRQQEGFFGLVDDVLAQVANKIPHDGGTMLRWDKGALWLLRSSPFFNYLDDPDDQTITRGIIRTAVRSYVL